MGTLTYPWTFVFLRKYPIEASFKKTPCTWNIAKIDKCKDIFYSIELFIVTIHSAVMREITWKSVCYYYVVAMRFWIITLREPIFAFLCVYYENKCRKMQSLKTSMKMKEFRQKLVPKKAPIPYLRTAKISFLKKVCVFAI